MQTVSTDLHPQGADTPLSADLSEQIATRKISEIIIDSTINTRAIDFDVVEDYKDAMRGYGASWQDSWNELPRITETNHLWSGFHTLTAAELVFSPRAQIRCVIEGENTRDAYFLATRTNAQHGRRRTNEEKRNSIDRWLEDEEMNLWTDSYIAKMCHVTHVFVGKRRLETISSQPTKRKFINAKGDIEWMHTSRIGLTPPPAPDPQKQIKTDYKAFVKHRDAAFDAWKRLCDTKEIPFDWESFCLHAEEYLDGKGCLSLPSPNDTTLDELREKSLICQKLTNAIIRKSPWLKGYYTHLEAKAEPIPDSDNSPLIRGVRGVTTEEASKSDLEGLRNNLERMQGSGTKPNPSILTKLYHVPEDVVRSEIKNYDFTEAEPIPAEEADTSTDSKHSMTMEEVESLYADIEEEIGDLTEPEQVEVRQFLKVNYNAYPTYQWRDMLKIDALETLGEALDQIQRGIKEKGVEAFKLSDPPLVSERTEPEQPAPLLSYPEDTDQQILNCKGVLSELIEAEGLPLIIKFAAEGFLETIEKHLLTKDREDA